VSAAAPHPAPPETAAPTLELRGVWAGYGQTTILRDIDVAVRRGRVTALIGPNGAGKTTLLRVAAGLVTATAGTVLVHGSEASRQRPSKRAAAGVCLIPEGRGVFPQLSVRDNLALMVPPWKKNRAIDQALEMFPALKGRLRHQAGSLSGGQQQLLALCRCYLADPEIILLDEVSMGLAPKIVDQIFDSLQALAQAGLGMLLVEQYVTRAIAIADSVVLLNRGRVVFERAPADIDQANLIRDYLGAPDAAIPLTDPRDGERGRQPPP
jgi:branched-chain amino acid transport system ATP-binding protein